MEFPPQNDILYLYEPLLIPKELDINFLGMVDTCMVQFWSQIVHLCESEGLTLESATKRIAELAPVPIGMQEWYLYKMRSLLGALFVGDDIQPRIVIIHAAEGRGALLCMSVVL